MRRRVFAAILLVTLLLCAPVATAKGGIVRVESSGRIADVALGIDDIALSPYRDQILLVGEEGYAHIIDAEEPSNQAKHIELFNSGSADLKSVDWHPQGETALLAGDSGTVMRYAKDDHSLTNVYGTALLEGTDIKALSWRSNGDVAFLGGEGGRIYRYNAGTGFEIIDQTATSDISGLDCHDNQLVCVVTTISNGIAIIDRTDQVHWLGRSAETWIDVICHDGQVNECVGISSGRRISVIHLNVENAGSSTVDSPVIVGSLAGEFIGASASKDGSVIIEMAPYSLIQFNMDKQTAYQMLPHENVKDAGLDLSGTSVAGAWGDDLQHGFIISSDGTIAVYSPPLAEEDDMMTKAILILVPVSVIGLIGGMIFMNSKTLQKWYYARRAAKREKRKLAALEGIKAEKAEKAAARKKKLAKQED